MPSLSLEELATLPCPVVCQAPRITRQPQSVPAACVLSGCPRARVDLHSGVFSAATTGSWAMAGSPRFFPLFLSAMKKGRGSCGADP